MNMVFKGFLQQIPNFTSFGREQNGSCLTHLRQGRCSIVVPPSCELLGAFCPAQLGRMCAPSVAA